MIKYHCIIIFLHFPHMSQHQNLGLFNIKNKFILTYYGCHDFWGKKLIYLRCLQVRSMDELNHDFQALALEGRAMGEVRNQHSRKLNTLFKNAAVLCELGTQAE